MPTYRNDTKSLSTGWKQETVEGTAETLTLTEFTGDWDASHIQLKYSTARVPGVVGTSKIVTGASYAELASFKFPMASKAEQPIMEAFGAVYSAGSPCYYTFGNGAYNGATSANIGRISTKAVTIGQYDGEELITMYGAKATSFKISAKAGEVIYAEAALQGSYTKTTTKVTTYQLPGAGKVNILKGATLSIGGQVFDYTDIDIDFKPSTKLVESGAATNGIVAVEVVDIDPRITISVYPGDPAVKDLWTMLSTNTQVPFSWTFGSGAGNTYTVTCDVGFESQEASYANNIQVRKLVLVPVFKSGTAYQMQIAVA